MTEISIVIPTYNNVQLFKAALTNILLQLDVKYEIIVVDDSIDDEICEFINTINSSNILYYKNVKRKGAVANWNYGLSLASGKFISLLHHDEHYPSYNYFLRDIVISLTEESDIVVGNLLVNDTLRNSKYNLFFPKSLKWFILNYFPDFLYFYNFVGPVSCVFFKADKLLLFDDKLCWFVDVHWYSRLFRKNKIKYLHNVFLESTLHHAGKITTEIDIRVELLKDCAMLKVDSETSFFVLYLVRMKLLLSKLIKSAPKIRVN